MTARSTGSVGSGLGEWLLQRVSALYIGAFAFTSKLVTEAEELRRLRWRCRRGLLELELILQVFVEQAYARLLPQERAAFGRLLSEPDPALLEYINGTQEAVDEELMCIVRKIRQYPDF